MRDEKEEKEKNISEIESDCLKEINEVLKKYNCLLDVSLTRDIVFDQSVVKFNPVIKYNK